MSAAIQKSAPASDQKKQLSEQEAAQIYQSRRSELQGIASKIGELEGEADEHKLVIDTLTEASNADPDRKCFRLIGGVLVERTVKQVLPALHTNLEGLKQILETLLKQYKQKETELQEFQREYAS
ncbi:related to GIM4 - Gim complex component (prefoldin subunit 2) [Melanopsichium pennsylvanicum]|uniref:Related to GIM4 - Gim complex component (Prefoldin subunit 2) n=2 Tax=Melanopsichium pennsylvanicum TaxID=63383 RepID=A0AAJ4XSP8_9BASI|nr:related to GIM4-Gim complex component (prefoldin subunit 2) [Melanopsichium pennsylvanicum 4]SNX87648.1 related to GIM4 - Gim complex component (prefoldin subunit 2) [Melanopsichium pennsylvanicum]